VLLAVREFHLAEGQGIEKLLPVIFCGFVVHTWLPRPLRLPFFILLTFLGIFLILGPTKAAWLIGIALALIGLCHVPIPFAGRVLLVLGAVGVLGAFQIGWLKGKDNLLLVIPFLGTIFMFRLVLYLYDLRHERTKVSVWQRLAYFFMLPNPVFWLFPVVDYKTYLRTYYQRDDFTIYQKGTLWMARGVVHLLLYQLVYHFLVPTYQAVDSLGMVAVFAVTSYLVYLLISGLFHLAIGILCLFGFDLPETHKNYLLATGFNDYWRRINIYWKEFMAKTVFFPVFMRARKLGQIPGLVISTAIVFLITWLLHSYQHFWLQAAFPVSMVDGLFWGIFGLLVIINTIYQAKSKPKPKPKGWDFRYALRLSIQTAAMFVLMCLLWSMWRTPVLSEWFNIMSQVTNNPLPGLLVVIGFLAVGIALGTLAQYLQHRGWKLGNDEESSPLRLGVTVILPMAGALLLAIPAVHEKLGAREMVKAMRGGYLNERDQSTLERAYYEGLMVSTNLTSQLRTLEFGDDGKDRDLLDPKFFRPTRDLLFREYLPSLSYELGGKPWSTNQFGMRDQDYALEKPDGVTRMAFLGASYIMGKGVADGEPFEAVLEDRLGREIEILNMGVDSYTPLEGAILCRDKVGKFDTDYVVYFEHGSAQLRLAKRLATRMVTPGLDLQFEGLENLKWRARAYEGVDEIEAARRVDAIADKALSWAYGEMVKQCREKNIHPVWVLLPRPRENNAPESMARLQKIAREAGFTALILEDPYRGTKPEKITLGKWDYHPNKLGHELIAESLYELLEKNQGELKLQLAPTSDQP